MRFATWILRTLSGVLWLCLNLSNCKLWDCRDLRLCNNLDSDGGLKPRPCCRSTWTPQHPLLLLLLFVETAVVFMSLKSLVPDPYSHRLTDMCWRTTRLTCAAESANLLSCLALLCDRMVAGVVSSVLAEAVTIQGWDMTPLADRRWRAFLINSLEMRSLAPSEMWPHSEVWNSNLPSCNKKRNVKPRFKTPYVHAMDSLLTYTSPNLT